MNIIPQVEIEPEEFHLERLSAHPEAYVLKPIPISDWDVLPSVEELVEYSFDLEEDYPLIGNEPSEEEWHAEVQAITEDLIQDFETEGNDDILKELFNWISETLSKMEHFELLTEVMDKEGAPPMTLEEFEAVLIRQAKLKIRFPLLTDEYAMWLALRLSPKDFDELIQHGPRIKSIETLEFWGLRLNA